uniref:Putative ubiquinone biosynthesis protein UbiB n=1 Tax=Anthurium amnicola TaxID=1678845 RepID=A0A1D1YP37_9ARAE
MTSKVSSLITQRKILQMKKKDLFQTVIWNYLEETLQSLKIEKFVIPAISELMHTWTVVFGFKPLDDLDKQEIKNMNLLVFPGTGLLHKSLLRQGNSTLMEGGATSVLVPNGSSSLHASDNDIFSCSTDARDEIENIKPSFAAASNSMHVTPEVSCQPSDASCNGPFGSCTDASRYKFLETALDEVCSVQDDMSHHDEPRGRSILCANNSIEPENQLSCEGAACNVVEGQVPETGTHPSGHRLLIQESPDGFGKSLDVPSDIPDFSEPVVHAKSWSAGNLSELKSEESCDHTLEVINENTTSSVLLSPASGVSTMRDVCGREDEVSVPADSIPNFDSHQAPEAVSASLKAMAGIISTDTLETNLHELVDDALHVMQ